MQSIGGRWFYEVLRRNGFQIEVKSMDLLEDFVAKLLEWNSKINLISRVSTDRVWSEHILHSVSPVLLGLIPTKGRIVDLGSGGGLPGIPISILLPEVQTTLVDSINKKMTAVNDIVSVLSLSNVTVKIGRAEELVDIRNKFDAVLARGVAPLKELVSWSKPLLSKDGQRLLIAYKGGELKEEIQAITTQSKKLGIKSIDIRLDGADELNKSEKKIIIVNL